MSEAKEGDDDGKKITMITIRLPRAMHKRLRVVAAQAERSLNKYLIEALQNHLSRVEGAES